jgi:hypothetical protein
MLRQMFNFNVKIFATSLCKVGAILYMGLQLQKNEKNFRLDWVFISVNMEEVIQSMIYNFTTALSHFKSCVT